MVDYSKWKEIEISDDEDETHPNIDTPSLFRWRHQARVERMEEWKKEKDKFEGEMNLHKTRHDELKKKLMEATDSGAIMKLKDDIEKLKLEEQALVQKQKEIEQKERLTPWNVDTISNPGFTKTVINKPQRRQEEQLSEDEKESRMKAFIKSNEKLLKEYGMLQKYDDSKRFLTEHPHLVCEDTANYLVIWCINLEMDDKATLMEHVAHQCICMQYMLELSKQLDVDPRACVSTFFSKIQVAEPEYKATFDEERRCFVDRIKRRALEKLEVALQEMELEEKKKRLGPGGLDPVEVFESLPEELQKCFESQDIPLLQETISKMPEDEASYHMKRCVDSGLWVPDGGKPKPEEQPVDS